MGVLSRVALNPYVTGSLFYLLGRNYPAVNEFLLRYVSEASVATVVKALKYLFGLGLVAHCNGFLNRWAENKWILRSDKAVWNWPDEVVVVTGGSNGVGASVAKMLAQRQTKVAVLDVQPLGDELKNVANITYYECDLRSREAVAKAGEAIRSELGEPSVLVNNAGIGHAHDILDATPEALRAMFDINIISHWFTIQEFLPAMIRKKRGHIMSVASMGSFATPAGMVDYSCCKVGLVALHEGLNQELKHRYHCPSIKTTIVHPSWTKTRLIGPLEADLKKSGAPVLEVDFVASKMVRQILEGKSGQLILPKSQTIATALRGFPTWLQESARDRTSGFVRVKGTSFGV